MYLDRGLQLLAQLSLLAGLGKGLLCLHLHTFVQYYYTKPIDDPEMRGAAGLLHLSTHT